ncbi:molybdenum cofactor biosynthesis protein MoaE [uncultured Desulfuromonas sp.]|uniref:molybdenum cofactor biosynthesis protein MoaE n=1 Tax=uncultured Desulfuromonas sp. TaxID=181013 RepID=UPI002AAB1039|nr:molybdenum cofactor biosynthesis protein MoaE [uncultured Desulfuromonas sp.]
MDISKTIAQMKQDPDFAPNVGMVLIHNGVVRGWSRKDGRDVEQIDISCDQAKASEICREVEQMPGIYKIAMEARSGRMKPGDDVLFLIVAGDIRENVKPALAILLDRIKAEAVTKKEHFDEDVA